VTFACSTCSGVGVQTNSAIGWQGTGMARSHRAFDN
jgi:hypothetical protein